MRKLIVLIFLFVVLTTTKCFSQNYYEVEAQKDFCGKSLQALNLLKIYVERKSLISSTRAVEIFNTEALVMNRFNKDSLKISAQDFMSIKNIWEFFRKLDYKKTLLMEMKSPKVKVNTEGKTFLWSKKTFMPLYTGIRVTMELIKRWLDQLE